METRISASAKILEIRDTGITIDDNPKVDLLLEITDKKQAEYKCQIQHIIPRLDVHKYNIGASLLVKINQVNRNDIVIEGLQKI